MVDARFGKGTTWALLAAVGLVATGCKEPEVTGSRPSGSSGGSSSSGGNGSGGSAPGGGAIALPDAAPSGPPSGGSGSGQNPIGEQCAETGAQAQQVPVDLLLLVDSSGSMAQPSGNSTKWALASDALIAFVKDPRSMGLGLGLGFFPRFPPEKVCTGNADCGGPNRFGNDTCVTTHLCGKAGQPVRLGGPACDDPLDVCDDPNQTCLPVGACSTSGDLCLGIGMPCPGANAGDLCQDRPKTCAVGSMATCSQNYEQASIGILALPGNEPALTDALLHQRPTGGTPMGPAVRGGIAQLRAHQMANLGRRVAIVLVSDGLPDSFCGGNFVAAVAGDLADAQTTMPPIPTYVIGVFSPEEIPEARPALEQLATAGGTGQPFILTTSADLGQRFQEALNQIRGTALSCEFTIPTGNAGIDFTKVNVRWKGAGGEEDLLYVGSMDRCDPTRGGWYFDVDPASGARPERVLICDASCKKFQSDAGATVELRFGCKTRAID